MAPKTKKPQIRDFFISYTSTDVGWAEWIAWTLADAGYTHYFQKWDFRPGGNFILEMQKASTESRKLLLVLSNSYLSALYTQPEWAATFVLDPTGERRLLIPVRVEPCEPAGMLRALVYCDLVALDKVEAKRKLLAALKPSGKPRVAPEFPGGRAAAPLKSAAEAFPGPATSAPRHKDGLRAAGEELQSIFATTRSTFIAQANLRDELAERIHARFNVRKHHEYEELFDVYFKRLRSDELRLHRIIRGYTKSVMHEYNVRTLEVLNREPGLARVLPSLQALRHHLTIWLSKYAEVFLNTPSMCLLYVGVEENAGFPPRIEDELNRYLAGRVHKRASEARAKEKRSRRRIESR